MNLLEDLNEEQKKAVTHIENPLLILAGAGSGKTKVLTTRLAYLIKEIGIPPENTLTLTFTNKAAKEMRERAFKILQNNNFILSNNPLLTTFHKFGLIFLRQYAHLLNISPNFTLRDSKDKQDILKNICKNEAKKADYLISNLKGRGITHEDKEEIYNQLESYKPSEATKFINIFDEYEKIMRFNSSLDFDDLILLPFLILDKFADVRSKVSLQYNYIMVDEYQDTNTIQYMLLKQLCCEHSNICAVGDDDQSIYEWRGANLSNMLNFSSHFKDTTTIKLETNYRSTTNILSLANNLISFNRKRLGKNLISSKGQGSNIKILKAANEKEEIALIVEEINKIIDNGGVYEDIAILFRLNALSRFIEMDLNRSEIPYKLIGVVRFFDRLEIKDAIAYFRLIANMHDNLSFARIINRPRRGIGDVSVNKMLQASKDTSVYQQYKNGAFNNEKFFKKLEEFFTLIERLSNMQDTPADLIDFFEREIILHDDDADNIDRFHNLQELYGLYREFFKRNSELTLQDFLNDLSLDSNAAENLNNGISCMSVHSSKGLEFKNVFIVGLEEGIFPLARYDEEDMTFNIEEERRLAYVAITRAKDKLFLSHSNYRNYRGNSRFLKPSRFFEEMKVSTSDNSIFFNRSAMEKLSVGHCVVHKVFGIGKIEKIGSGDIFLVNFGGVKRNLLKSSLKSI